MYLCIVYYYILIYIDSLPLTISYLYNEHSLLENTPWEPVGNILRHRFSNRFPQTETNGLVFRHWIFSTGALGFHWYRLERPTGTKEAATLAALWYRLVFPTGTRTATAIPSILLSRSPHILH